MREGSCPQCDPKGSPGQLNWRPRDRVTLFFSTTNNVVWWIGQETTAAHRNAPDTIDTINIGGAYRMDLDVKSLYILTEWVWHSLDVTFSIWPPETHTHTLSTLGSFMLQAGHFITALPLHKFNLCKHLQLLIYGPIKQALMSVSGVWGEALLTGRCWQGIRGRWGGQGGKGMRTGAGRQGGGSWHPNGRAQARMLMNPYPSRTVCFVLSVPLPGLLSLHSATLHREHMANNVAHVNRTVSFTGHELL